MTAIPAPPPARLGRLFALLALSLSLSCSAEEFGAPASPAADSTAPSQLASLAPLDKPVSPKDLATQQAVGTDTQEDHTKPAVAAALADGITTGMAVSSGALESNPLIAPTPVGLVALTGVKIGLVKYADTLPQEDKRLALKSTSAIWGGAAVNNVMVLLAAPPPFPIIAGLVMGIATWSHMQQQYDEEDRKLAARNMARQQAAAAPVKLPELVQVSEKMGN
jgi:hypothetical protein